MTMRSKQWYAKVSRLPNSLANSSFGPLPPCALELASRAWDRGPMVVKDSRLSDYATLGPERPTLYRPLRRARGNFKYFWVGLGRIQRGTRSHRAGPGSARPPTSEWMTSASCAWA